VLYRKTISINLVSLQIALQGPHSAEVV